MKVAIENAPQEKCMSRMFILYLPDTNPMEEYHGLGIQRRPAVFVGLIFNSVYKNAIVLLEPFLTRHS